MKDDSPDLDKDAIRLHAIRAARFDQQDNFIARRCGEELIERLTLLNLRPEAILDLGCGVGLESARLQEKFPDAVIVGADLVANDIPASARATQGLCTADGTELPFADDRFDLVFANLLLPFVDVQKVLSEISRVLRVGGVLTLSSFGPDTLTELVAAWRVVESYPHVHHFHDMHDLGDALLEAGFSEPVMDVDVIGLTYLNIRKLVRDLRLLGGASGLTVRTRGLTGKTRWRALEAAYRPMAGSDGRIRATFELVYGIAWSRKAARRSDGGIRVAFDGVTST